MHGKPSLLLSLCSIIHNLSFLSLRPQYGHDGCWSLSCRNGKRVLQVHLAPLRIPARCHTKHLCLHPRYLGHTWLQKILGISPFFTVVVGSIPSLKWVFYYYERRIILSRQFVVYHIDFRVLFAYWISQMVMMANTHSVLTLSGTAWEGLHVLAHIIHPVCTEVGAITISTLVMRKLRHREGK